MSTAVETLSPTERRLRWEVMGTSGSTTSTRLRSGIALSSSSISWEQSFEMSVAHAPSSIKLILMRGSGPRLSIDSGSGDADSHRLSGGMLHMGQIKRPVRMEFAFDEQANKTQHEQLSLEIERSRLVELLGTSKLPDPLEHVLAGSSAYPTRALPMGPALHRLFDEVALCDARGSSRALHLEAKGLELLAALVDRIEESGCAQPARLSNLDRDQLERARQILLERMSDPPSVPELARAAGINAFKLKTGFRALFGCPVHTYLRERRMEEARRLLLQRRYTVTEVAARVGYTNPSKFAAAFRKRFGLSPSDVA